MQACVACPAASALPALLVPAPTNLTSRLLRSLWRWFLVMVILVVVLSTKFVPRKRACDRSAFERVRAGAAGGVGGIIYLCAAGCRREATGADVWIWSAGRARLGPGSLGWPRAPSSIHELVRGSYCTHALVPRVRCKICVACVCSCSPVHVTAAPAADGVACSCAWLGA